MGGLGECASSPPTLAMLVRQINRRRTISVESSLHLATSGVANHRMINHEMGFSASWMENRIFGEGLVVGVGWGRGEQTSITVLQERKGRDCMAKARARTYATGAIGSSSKL